MSAPKSNKNSLTTNFVSVNPELQNWLLDFSAHLKTKTDSAEEVINLPENFANGFARVIELEKGLTYRIVNQAARLGGGGHQPQVAADGPAEAAPGLPGRARHGADPGGGLRQQGLLPPRPRVSSPSSRGTPPPAPSSTTRKTRTRRAAS